MSIKCFMVEPTGYVNQWRRIDTGEVFEMMNAPVGAMFNADWLNEHKWYCGEDGLSLHVVTPGGTWFIDGQASNCTRKDDRIHKCWVRHGVPPMITVDKNGDTCQAGAGSIQIGNYHGFLRNGELTTD